MKRPTRFWLLLLSLVKFLLPFLLIHPAFELHRDEFLYLAEARHLAWGYLEAPPLLSLLAVLSWAGGTEALWVRVWPALFGALTFYFSGCMLLRLGGKTFGLTILFLAFTFSAFLRVHSLFQPNILDIFFWTLSCYCWLCYIQENDRAAGAKETSNSGEGVTMREPLNAGSVPGARYLYLAGIAGGLGMLSKYTMLFFLAALLAGLCLSRQRRILLRKEPYLAALLGLLIFLPNLAWQYLHRFPILHHMRELQETQLRFGDPSSFLKEQFLLTLPVCFVWILGLWHLARDPGGKKYRLFGWTFLMVILLLMLGSGKAYYALGIYPVLLALGAFRLEKISERRPFLRYASLLFILITGIPLLPVLTPLWSPGRLTTYYEDSGLGKTGILKWEDQQEHALPQDFADMLGRKELLRKTLGAYARIPPGDRGATLIFCEHYGQAGALNYYGRGSGLPEAQSTSASFLLWIPRFGEARHMIWIGGKDLPFPALHQQFREVVLIDSITDALSREYGTGIYWLRDASPGLPARLNQEVQRMQERFAPRDVRRPATAGFTYRASAPRPAPGKLCGSSPVHP